MILKAIMQPLWFLVDFIISVLPSSALEFVLDGAIFPILAKGVSVMGFDNFVFYLSSFLFWYTVQLTWAVIEWIYKKIPGID